MRHRAHQGRPTYIHELDDWPNFRWDEQAIASTLERANALARQLRFANELHLHNLTLSAVASSQIEGEYPDPVAVRDAIIRLIAERHPWAGPDAEPGIAAVMTNAAIRWRERLTVDTLHQWQRLAIPRRGPITWRAHGGPAWAPSADRLDHKVAQFLEWFNDRGTPVNLTKPAVAHLWFSTLAPYDGGNVPVALAIMETALSRCDRSAARHYSMSAEIMRRRDEYRQVLADTRAGSMDVTNWMTWFLECLETALSLAHEANRPSVRPTD